MVEESPRELIIKYVMKHDGCSQAQIINYMRGQDSKGEPVKEKSPILLAQQTTLDRLEELIGEKGSEAPILFTKPSKKNRRYLTYHVIDDLKLIDEQLHDISSLISTMGLPVHKLNKLISQAMSLPEGDRKNIPLTSNLMHPKLYGPYINGYSAAVRSILYYLFEKWSIMKISKDHSSIIYDRIIELSRKLNEQTLETRDPKGDLQLIKDEFLKLKVALDTNAVANLYFNHKIVDKVIGTLNNFNNRF